MPTTPRRSPLSQARPLAAELVAGSTWLRHWEAVSLCISFSVALSADCALSQVCQAFAGCHCASPFAGVDSEQTFFLRNFFLSQACHFAHHTQVPPLCAHLICRVACICHLCGTQVAWHFSAPPGRRLQQSHCFVFVRTMHGVCMLSLFTCVSVITHFNQRPSRLSFVICQFSKNGGGGMQGRWQVDISLVTRSGTSAGAETKYQSNRMSVSTPMKKHDTEQSNWRVSSPLAGRAMPGAFQYTIACVPLSTSQDPKMKMSRPQDCVVACSPLQQHLAAASCRPGLVHRLNHLVQRILLACTTIQAQRFQALLVSHAASCTTPTSHPEEGAAALCKLLEQTQLACQHPFSSFVTRTHSTPHTP